MTAAHYPWLKTLQASLRASQEIPLWGRFPPFPWHACSEHVQEALQIQNLSITHHATEWLSAEEIGKGMGEAPLVLSIELSPLKETALWIMPKEDASKLTAYLLSQDHPTKGFFDSRLEEGFYRYLALQIAEAIDQLHAFKDLSVKIGNREPLPTSSALCTDVRIELDPHCTLWGRIAIPELFLSALKSHAALEPFSISSNQLSSEIPLTLRLDIGNTTLSTKEWREVKSGDLIVLDRCSYDPETHKGTFSVLVNNIPLFRARFKDQSIKILDYTFYHEEGMDKETPEEDDEEFFEGEEDEADEENEEASEEENSEDEESDEHLWSSEEKEETLEETIASEEIPITLTVEVAKLTMPLQQLLELKPGNTLDLAVHPEQGVRLTVGGKTVAHAELVKLGDLLGVKILQVGHS